MTGIEWEHVDTLTGSGSITHGETGESLPVAYRIEIWQEFLEPRPGVRYPRRTETRGHIDPVPSWPFSSHFSILQLEDGRRLKCWITNQNGELIGSGELIEN